VRTRNSIDKVAMLDWQCRRAVLAKPTGELSNWHLFNGRRALKSVAGTGAESLVSTTWIHARQSYMWRGTVCVLSAY